MQILVVAATELEILPFLKRNISANFLITGIGCPGCIYHLTQRLHQVDYDLVIQAGIAGCFTKELNSGDVVIVQHDAFGDLGVSEQNQFHTIFEKGFSDENAFPFSNGWLSNNDPLLQILDYPRVKAVTVNKITDDEKQIAQLISKFNAQVETMEGAALHFTCLQQGIRFLQLRSISNLVGERDKKKWDMKGSIRNLNEALQKIIDDLKIQP